MPASKKTDTGAAEVQAAVDADLEKGYHGSVPDPFPNSAYSLVSGPDSPTLAETRKAIEAAKKEGDK